MTMAKSDSKNIWSFVREDIDVDDLIFNYETYHVRECDDSAAER